jgi:Bacterial regulatory proteins, luxR family.
MTVQERREKVAELAKAGKSERAIAAELGVSRTTVWTDKQVAAASAKS